MGTRRRSRPVVARRRPAKKPNWRRVAQMLRGKPKPVTLPRITLPSIEVVDRSE